MKEKPINKLTFKQKLSSYKRSKQSLFLYILTLIGAILTLLSLLFIVGYILVKGISHITPSLFELNYNSSNVSLMPALINTVLITVISLLLAVPMGIAAAIYLTQYTSSKNRLVGIVRLTAETLSGIPSIIFGLFGALFFVKFLKMGLSLIAGSLTLCVMILPLIIRTAEEALLSVPSDFKEGSFALGAGRLRTVMSVVLPCAVPGILSGIILSIGRIVGESAALVFTAGTVAQTAVRLSDSARTLSVHMYVLSGEGMYIDQTYATALVLLVVILLINRLSHSLVNKIGGVKK